MSFLRRRRGSDGQTSGLGNDSDEDKHEKADRSRQGGKKVKEGKRGRWSCVDSCCRTVGFICSSWWLLLFVYNVMPASFPQYVTEAIIGGPMPDPPGVKLRKEGLTAEHPVVFVPGIVTGGLELWEGPFRKRLWGGTFGELYKRTFAPGFL